MANKPAGSGLELLTRGSTVGETDLTISGGYAYSLLGEFGIGELSRVSLTDESSLVVASATTILSYAVNTSKAYWATKDTAAGTTDGRIEVSPLAGGAATDLVVGLNSPTNLVIQAGTLYYVDDGSIWQVPITGGSPAAVTTGIDQLVLWAVDDSNAYYSSSTAIVELPLDGGAPVTIANIPSFTKVFQLVVNRGTVYWTQSQENTGGVGIVSMAAAGKPATTLASMQESIGPIGVDGEFVYWTSSSAGCSPNKTCIYHGQLDKISTLTGKISRLASVNETTSLAIDESGIYWADFDEGGASTIVKTDK